MPPDIRLTGILSQTEIESHEDLKITSSFLQIEVDDGPPPQPSKKRRYATFI